MRDRRSERKSEMQGWRPVSRHSREIASTQAGNKAENDSGALLAASRRVEKPEAPVKHDSLTNTHGDRSGTALEFTIGWDGW